MGLNENQLGNLARGGIPGLKLCQDIADYFHWPLMTVLYWAGHIKEEELDSPDRIPPELMPTIRKLASMRGTPFYDTALSMFENMVDKVIELFKVAA